MTNDPAWHRVGSLVVILIHFIADVDITDKLLYTVVLVMFSVWIYFLVPACFINAHKYGLGTCPKFEPIAEFDWDEVNHKIYIL